MANKEFSNVYLTIAFCNSMRTYYLYALFFRQIKTVVITDASCIIINKSLLLLPKTYLSLIYQKHIMPQ